MIDASRATEDLTESNAPLPRKWRPRLLIFKTAADTYRMVFQRMRFLPAASALPAGFAVLFLLLEFVRKRFGYESTASDNFVVTELWWDLTLSAYLLVFVAFAVNWHRIVLYDPGVGNRTLPKFLGKIHWRYFASWISGVLFPSTILWFFFLICTTVFLAFLWMLEFEPGMGSRDASSELVPGSSWIPRGVSIPIPDYIPALTIFIGPGLAWRGFYLPADATESKYSAADNTRDRHGQFLSRLACYYLCIAPFLPVYWLYDKFFADLDLVLIYNLAEITLFESLLDFFCLLIVVTFISLAFKTTTGWTPDQGEEPGTVKRN